MTSSSQITITTTKDHRNDITFTTELRKSLHGKNVNIYMSYYALLLGSKTSITLKLKQVLRIKILKIQTVLFNLHFHTHQRTLTINIDFN